MPVILQGRLCVYCSAMLNISKGQLEYQNYGVFFNHHSKSVMHNFQ